MVTKRLRVVCDTSTGALAYFESGKGAPLLQQCRPTSFTAQSILGQAGFTAAQQFSMPAGEAYYGLGGHQNGVLNYAGESVQMVQDNTEDVNPFLLSSKGYGLLWDSASAMHIDFGGAAQPIPSARFFDDSGKPGNLSGHYFKGRQFEEHAADRLDPQVNFEWNDHGPVGLAHDDYSVRWTGSIETEQAGDYQFVTAGDDGVRLWVDGKKIVDDWRDRPVTANTGRIRLAAHRRYPIKMEYYQHSGGAAVSLRWRPPALKPVVNWSAEYVDQADTYFILGPQLDSVVKQYRQITGQAPLFGKWAYGYWQCKERYSSQQELLDIASGFRSRKIPIDNIVQDWFYWDPHPWGSHEFDLKRYPDMKSAIDQLHAEHLHLMISVWGKFAPGSDNYNELDKAGVLYPPMGDWSSPNMRYYDAFSKKGRDIYWRQMWSELLTKGVDAWWLDATEPEISMDMYRKTQTAIGPGNRVLNAYSLKDTEGVYRGNRNATGKRVFILTRSVFAGQQRNSAATWSGDIQGNWETFRKQIPCGLNFCMAGVPYWCTDTGGFFSHPPTDPGYAELFTRWFQYSTFNPLLRVHGTGANKEPWRFSPDVEKIIVDYDRLRYRLLPTVYSLAWRVTHDGDTIMRGLPMEDNRDPRLLSISDEFMFGHSILVSPVVQPGAKSRSVYLPKSGNWIDFWNGSRHMGGTSLLVDADLAQVPLFLKQGSIVPMGPELEYSSEKPADPIELRVYPGADADFTLYEDAGDGYGYERGERATIPIHWSDRARTLSIGARTGSFPGMLGKRTFHIVVVQPGRGLGIGEEPHPDKVVSYSGAKLTVSGL